MSYRRAACLLLVMAGIAACGSPPQALASAAPGSPAAAGVVPWTADPPTYPPYAPPTAAPQPTGIARCRAADLRLEARPYGGAMGSVYGAIHLVNDAAPLCLVSGTFTLEFLDARGVVALRAEPPRACA